jgi:leader peptidase (prepilin peptidase)/N-methyltransferase
VHEELALATTPAAGALAVVLGLLWGSFANVCIYRWPADKSVVRPASHCSACGTPIRWYDNIPILAYLWLRGRCRACGKQFSARYLVVEALTGALFGVAWWFTLGDGGILAGSLEVRGLRFVIDATFLLCMVVIAFIDLDTKLILDKITYPAIPLFYAASLALPEHRWWDGLIGAAVGYAVPWSIDRLYMLVRGQEGIGIGDFKLLALVGALMGWKGVVASLFGGSIVGTVITVPMLLAARKEQVLKMEVPFGPFLAIGAVFYLFAEPWLVTSFRL